MRKLFTLLILVYWAPPQICFSQNPCDTIRTTDGSSLLVEIIRRDGNVLAYYNCNEASGSRYEINMDKVVSIHPHNKPPIIIGSAAKPSGNQPKSAEVKPATTPKKPIISKQPELPYPKKDPRKKRPPSFRPPEPPGKSKPIIWVGGRGNTILEDSTASRLLNLMAVEFGAEFTLKNAPGIHLAGFVAPFSALYYEKAGLTGSLGFSFKYFNVGPLSGYRHKMYYGFDIRVAKGEYRYNHADTYVQKNTYSAITTCIGFQVSNKRIAFDGSFPIGVAWVKKSSSLVSNRVMVICPSLSFGIKL